MPFSLSVQAEEDIIFIAEEGIRIFGALVARQYHDELFALLELIATNPRMARERMRFLLLSGSILSRLTLSCTASLKTGAYSSSAYGTAMKIGREILSNQPLRRIYNILVVSANLIKS